MSEDLHLLIHYVTDVRGSLVLTVLHSCRPCSGKHLPTWKHCQPVWENARHKCMRRQHSCHLPDLLPGATSTSSKAWTHLTGKYPSASLLPAAHLHSLETKICASTDTMEVLAHPNILVPTTALGGWAELWTGSPERWASTFKLNSHSWSWIPTVASSLGIQWYLQDTWVSKLCPAASHASPGSTAVSWGTRMSCWKEETKQ